MFELTNTLIGTGEYKFVVYPSRSSDELGLYNMGDRIYRGNCCFEVCGEIKHAWSVSAMFAYRVYDLSDTFVIVQSNKCSPYRMTSLGQIQPCGNFLSNTLHDDSMELLDVHTRPSGSFYCNEDMNEQYRRPNCELVAVGTGLKTRLFLRCIRDVVPDMEFVYALPNPTLPCFGHHNWSDMSLESRGSKLATEVLSGWYVDRFHGMCMVGLHLLDCIRADLDDPERLLSSVFPYYQIAFMNHRGDDEAENFWDAELICTNRFFRLIRDVYDEILLHLTNAALRPDADRVNSYIQRPFDPDWWSDFRAIDTYALVDCQRSNRVYRPFATNLFGPQIDPEAHPYGYDRPELFERADRHTPGCTCRSCRREYVFV